MKDQNLKNRIEAIEFAIVRLGMAADHTTPSNTPHVHNAIVELRILHTELVLQDCNAQRLKQSRPLPRRDWNEIEESDYLG